MIFLRILALAAFVFIPGWLAVSLLGERAAGLREGERLFLAWVAGMGLAALCAEILALAKVYSLTDLLLTVGSVSLLLALAARARVRWLRKVGAKELLMALALVAVAFFLFLPPGHTIHSFSDVGVYPNIAAKIAREGALHTEYLVVKEVSPECRHILYWTNLQPALPYKAIAGSGFFITDFESGKVVPQFYYLWPSLLAVFSSFLGLENMFWAVTAAAVLGLWGIFLLAIRLLGRRWGFVALLLAALSPLMLYFSRYTTSEMLNLALFGAGSLCLTAYLQLREKEENGGQIALAVAAALYFAVGFLCRIDFCLVVLPLVAFFFCKRVLGGMREADWWFLGLSVAGAAVSLLVGAKFSGPYFFDTWRKTLGGALWLFRFPGALLLASLLLALALAFFFGPRLRDQAMKLARLRKAGLVLVWVALAAFFVYVYFIRSMKVMPPDTKAPVDPSTGFSLENQALVRWAWYFSFTGLIFIYAGYALWISRARRYWQWPVVLMGLTFTFIYSWSLNCTPLQFLSMRRLMPVAMPLAVIMIAYVLKSLPEGAAWLCRQRSWASRLGKAVAGGLLLYFLLFSVNVSVPLFGLREGGNQVELCREIAGRVEGGMVLIDYRLGPRFGPPLRCFCGAEEGWLFGNNKMQREDFKTLLGDLGFPDTPVYLLWWPAASGADVSLVEGLGLEEVSEFSWREEAMELIFLYRPRKRVYNVENLKLYRFKREG